MRDWRTQPVVVMGKTFALGAVAGGRLYHGSPISLPVGTILEPGHGRQYKQSASDAVSITSNPERAGYWAAGAKKGALHVYEIEPVGTVEAWRVGLADMGRSFDLWEGRVAKARIIRRVTRSGKKRHASRKCSMKTARKTVAASRPSDWPEGYPEPPRGFNWVAPDYCKYPDGYCDGSCEACTEAAKVARLLKKG
jgi:hypothetical protein